MGNYIQLKDNVLQLMYQYHTEKSMTDSKYRSKKHDLIQRYLKNRINAEGKYYTNVTKNIEDFNIDKYEEVINELYNPFDIKIKFLDKEFLSKNLVKNYGQFKELRVFNIKTDYYPSTNIIQVNDIKICVYDFYKYSKTNEVSGHFNSTYIQKLINIHFKKKYTEKYA